MYVYIGEREKDDKQDKRDRWIRPASTYVVAVALGISCVEDRRGQ